MAEAVKVAVRVRPFNQREIDYKTSLVIDMQGMIQLNRVEPPGTAQPFLVPFFNVVSPRKSGSRYR